MLLRGMAETEEAFEVWSVGGRGGAWQWWTGYVNAVKGARLRLSGRPIPHPPEMARREYGRLWALKVRGYAVDLALEALEEAES